MRRASVIAEGEEEQCWRTAPLPKYRVCTRGEERLAFAGESGTIKNFHATLS
jgi:hypothetical protein